MTGRKRLLFRQEITQIYNGAFRDKGKETHLARFKYPYLAMSQMIRINDKYKSIMAEISFFGKTI